MAREREVKVTILGDSKGGQRALAELDAKADKTGSHFDGLGSKVAGFGKMAAVGLAGAAVAAGGFVVKAVSSGSDLAESLSKSNTIFGQSAAEMEKWAGTASRSFGQSKTQALEAGATFGNMFTQLGIGSGEAAKMSRSMVELASDFASFHNADISEVLQAQTAAFRGEYDAVQRFVPTINAAAVEEKALAMGLASTTKELTMQDKALATQALLMEGAGAAMGDYDRTSKGLANRMRELKARGEDFAASVGTAVIPVLLKVMDAGEKVGGALKGAFDILTKGDFTGGMGLEEDSPIIAGLFRLRETALDLVTKFKEWWPQIKETVLSAVTAIVGWVQENWPRIKTIISETMETVGSVIRGVIDVVTVIWENFGSQIMAVVSAAWTFISGTIENAMNAIQGIIQVVTSIIQGDWGAAWDGIKQILSAAWDQIKEIIRLGIDLAREIISTGWELVKGVFTGAWDAIKGLVREGVAAIVGYFLGMAESVVDLAAAAFGWVPGVGEKVRAAARAVEEFRDRTNAALRGTASEKTINVYHNTYHTDYYRTVRGMDPWVGSMHTGGIVPGSGDVPMILEGGEGVFTPEQMAVLGASMGRGGGGDGAHVVVNITVAGSVVTEHDLVEAVHAGLAQKDRRVPSLGLT